MNKINPGILVFLILFISCNNRKDVCHLTGQLENAPDSTKLLLADWESKTLLDSIPVIKGQFDYQFTIAHPKYFLLHNERNRYPFRDSKFIWIEPGETNISGNFEFLKNIKLEGSLSQKEFENYNSLVDNATKKINEIKEQIHFKTLVEKRKDTLRIDSLNKKLNDNITLFLTEHADSYVTLNTLHNESYLGLRHLNKRQIKTVYEKMPEHLKESNQGMEIKKYIKLPEPPKVGDIAPDIAQLTPDGDTVKLSDFRGKYVLLDFWASWCAPCRGDIKWTRKLYQKYHPKGFEILGISGDSNKKDWTDAIQQNSIPWTNISDLKGWNNEAFLLYDIKGIPQNLLVDPSGVIIRQNLCSEYYMDNELAKIFGNEMQLNTTKL